MLQQKSLEKLINKSILILIGNCKKNNKKNLKNNKITLFKRICIFNQVYSYLNCNYRRRDSWIKCGSPIDNRWTCNSFVNQDI
ncbi:unnamed protein product [Paramecium octaurelia]|uniref:Uncharacterized protein n=1 Tax=Paramecium octaurelia TaxID=43137 RepID=A0A8S1WJ07_PAROT|nr:unnamed protein product [Paramecium octaurelia]